MRTALSLALLAHLVSASPIVIGQQTTDVYPPTGTSVDRNLFPPESVVGYYGPTPTGAQAFAYQTAPAGQFPGFQDEFGPLFQPKAKDVRPTRGLRSY